MTVGFYHVDRARSGQVDRSLPIAMVASVKRCLPGVAIFQFSTSPDHKVPGADSVIVRPELPLALAFLDARAHCEGEWLFLDTDVIVQRDVRHVFDQPFDVAVATREGTMKPHEIGSRFMARNRYNAGVAFSRSMAFWLDALERGRKMSPGRHEWGCDQESMNAVIATERFQTLELSNDFNYAPHASDEDVRRKAIVHYKGKRKAWIQQRAAA